MQNFVSLYFTRVLFPPRRTLCYETCRGVGSVLPPSPFFASVDFFPFPDIYVRIFWGWMGVVAFSFAAFSAVVGWKEEKNCDGSLLTNINASWRAQCSEKHEETKSQSQPRLRAWPKKDFFQKGIRVFWVKESMNQSN